MATIKDVQTWIERDICRFGKASDHFELTATKNSMGEESLMLIIYTDTNRYCISARDGLGNDGGYLGCVAAARKPRAGEDWARGNDLPDGPMNEDTWRNILAGIVSYEMVRVHRPKPAQVVESMKSGQS